MEHFMIDTEVIYKCIMMLLAVHSNNAQNLIYLKSLTEKEESASPFLRSCSLQSDQRLWKQQQPLQHPDKGQHCLRMPALLKGEGGSGFPATVCMTFPRPITTTPFTVSQTAKHHLLHCSLRKPGSRHRTCFFQPPALHMKGPQSPLRFLPEHA